MYWNFDDDGGGKTEEGSLVHPRKGFEERERMEQNRWEKKRKKKEMKMVKVSRKKRKKKKNNFYEI